MQRPGRNLEIYYEKFATPYKWQQRCNGLRKINQSFKSFEVGNFHLLVNFYKQVTSPYNNYCNAMLFAALEKLKFFSVALLVFGKFVWVEHTNEFNVQTAVFKLFSSTTFSIFPASQKHSWLELKRKKMRKKIQNN